MVTYSCQTRPASMYVLLYSVKELITISTSGQSEKVGCFLSFPCWQQAVDSPRAAGKLIRNFPGAVRVPLYALYGRGPKHRPASVRGANRTLYSGTNALWR
jgi:hypothetical protein